jgi:predicted Zn-dependent protease
MTTLDEPRSDFLYLLAILYMQQSKYNPALHLLRVLSIQHEKDTRIALALASCLYRTKRLKKAQSVLSELDETVLSPEFRAAFHYINAKILWELEQKNEARDQLQKYLKARETA